MRPQTAGCQWDDVLNCVGGYGRRVGIRRDEEERRGGTHGITPIASLSSVPVTPNGDGQREHLARRTTYLLPCNSDWTVSPS